MLVLSSFPTAVTKTPGEITLKGERFILLCEISPLPLAPVQRGRASWSEADSGHVCLAHGGHQGWGGEEEKGGERRSRGGVRRGKRRRKGKKRGEEKGEPRSWMEPGKRPTRPKQMSLTHWLQLDSTSLCLQLDPTSLWWFGENYHPPHIWTLDLQLLVFVEAVEPLGVRICWRKYLVGDGFEGL